MNPTYPYPDGSPVTYGGLPTVPPRRNWRLWGCVGCVGLVVLVGIGVLGFCIYIEWAWLIAPPTPGRQVPARVVRKLRDLELLQQDEKLGYLAANGMFRIEEDLSFFTQRRLVLHCEEWESPTAAVNLRDIDSITPTFGESSLDYTYLEVLSEDGTELTVTLGTDGGGDKRFYEALKRAWELARRDTAPPSPGGK